MKKFFVMLIFVFGYIQVNAQGCSDAGICTLDNFQANTTDSIVFKNEFKIASNIGFADNDVIVFGSYLEFKKRLSKGVDVDVKLNFFNQSANRISSSALSDIYFVSNFKITTSIKGTVGIKIPLTNGNLKENGNPLPMDFQPSLGTFDLLLGVSKNYKKYSFAFAYQQPLTQNENQYFAPMNSKFITTNNFKRAGDLMFRASKRYQINPNLTLSPGFLSIFHLDKDKFTDAANNEQDIEGSDGLTINASGYLNYQLNQKSALEFSLGFPLIVRKVRPDGLTRGLVVNVEYKIKF
ncbi:hypothetical protein [Flavobacterium sp.]|uniref:hypothetical protein n=1 Tax=Flavobacterium sp. TaxID=239 RepID=UPI003F69B342